ncbi:MAG: hypothetical protein ACIPMY_05680 [Rickettsia endosymbiont of Pentastiridius leporinus]
MPEVSEKQIKEIIIGARNDIRDIEGYVLGQLKNQIIADKKPIDINSEDFKKAFKGTFEADPNETSIIEINGKKEVVKNNVINVPATILAINERIQGAVEAGASPDSFKELKQEMDKFSSEFREAFTSNEKINNLVKSRFKQEMVNEAVPFDELIGGQVAQMNMGEKKNLVNNIYKNIEILDKLYEDIVIHGNNGLKAQLVTNIIEPEIRKSFGNPTITLRNEYDEAYQVTTLNKVKLVNPQNVKNFNEAVNNKIIEFNNRLILNEKISKELKDITPPLTDTQIKQYQNALSKLDTKYLEENKDKVFDSLKHLHETTKLSLPEKVYNYVREKNQEEYLAEKVGKLAVKAFINNQDINNKPIINRANTNNVLSQPTKNLSKIKEQTAKMQKTFKNYPITQVSITTPPNTPSIKKQNKENQR